MIKISSRGLAIGLIASLALNLFLGGALVARQVFHRGHFRITAEGPYPRWAKKAKLSTEQTAKVQAIWKENYPEVRTRMRAMRLARRQMRARLFADPLDPKALDRAAADVRARSMETQRYVHDMMGKVAATMTADERRRFFRRLFRRRHHGRSSFGPPR